MISDFFGTEWLISIQNPLQGFADNCHFVFGQIIIEWQSDCSLTDGLGNRKIALPVAELLSYEGLQMYGRKIITDLNAPTFHILQNLVALLRSKSR